MIALRLNPAVVAAGCFALVWGMASDVWAQNPNWLSGGRAPVCAACGHDGSAMAGGRHCFGKAKCRLGKSWKCMEPPRGPVVYSVPAVMVPQHALPVDPREFHAFALRRYGHDDPAAQVKKFSEQLEAFSKRLEQETQAQSYSAEPSKGELSVDQRLEILERNLETLTRHVESRLSNPNE